MESVVPSKLEMTPSTVCWEGSQLRSGGRLGFAAALFFLASSNLDNMENLWCNKAEMPLARLPFDNRQVKPAIQRHGDPTSIAWIQENKFMSLAKWNAFDCLSVGSCYLTKRAKVPRIPCAKLG